MANGQTHRRPARKEARRSRQPNILTSSSQEYQHPDHDAIAAKALDEESEPLLPPPDRRDYAQVRASRPSQRRVFKTARSRARAEPRTLESKLQRTLHLRNGSEERIKIFRTLDGATLRRASHEPPGTLVRATFDTLARGPCADETVARTLLEHMLELDNNKDGTWVCFFCYGLLPRGAFSANPPEHALKHPHERRCRPYQNVVPPGCQLVTPRRFCMPCGAREGFYPPENSIDSAEPQTIPVNWTNRTPKWWVCDCLRLRSIPNVGENLGYDRCPNCARTAPLR